jgi:hypothetical protein
LAFALDRDGQPLIGEQALVDHDTDPKNVIMGIFQLSYSSCSNV